MAGERNANNDVRRYPVLDAPRFVLAFWVAIGFILGSTYAFSIVVARPSHHLAGSLGTVPHRNEFRNLRGMTPTHHAVNRAESSPSDTCKPQRVGAHGDTWTLQAYDLPERDRVCCIIWGYVGWVSVSFKRLDNVRCAATHLRIDE